MILKTEEIIQDLLNFVASKGYTLTAQALEIFNKVEKMCYEYNVSVFPDDFLIVAINEVSLFRDAIRKHGGNPELALPVLIEELETRSKEKLINYEPDLYSTSSGRDLITKTQILDISISIVQSRKCNEIKDVDLILAILDYHDQKWPIWNNCDWTDKRLNTPFNTISHLAAIYLEFLWVTFDTVRSELRNMYDLAISFAGEDRGVAKEIANLISNDGFKVFYDEYEKAHLWGKDLYSHLTEVYSKKSKILFNDYIPVLC